ncbi:MAG: efflux RND transporter periplasmic adaptor subunit [Bacteroidetes bacterium]|nr:efflux RND transporter periplasmic adaptor subunit [Bacteroidota bacterium]
MNKYIKFAIIILVIGAALYFIIPKLSSKEKPQTQNQSQGDGTTSADGYVIKSTDLDNEIQAVGTIRANEEVEIRSEVSRKITGIYFKEGSKVGRGKTLFKLDDADLIASMNKLKLDEQLAVLNEKRNKELLDKGLLSQSDYDIQINNLAKIRADMESIQIQIDKTNIRAPFSGFVGLRNVSVGSYATPTNVLTTMQDLSKLKIDFSIPEKYINFFKIGQKIFFKVAGIDEEYEGEVYAFEPKVENGTKTLILRAISNRSNSKLLPGSFTNVRLIMKQISDAMLVPTQAVIPNLKGQSVYIADNGKVKEVSVELGNRLEDMVQIIGDIKQGDTLITTNILRLKPNSKVKIVKVSN